MGPQSVFQGGLLLLDYLAVCAGASDRACWGHNVCTRVYGATKCVTGCADVMGAQSAGLLLLDYLALRAGACHRVC
jgi:hypothetical protein